MSAAAGPLLLQPSIVMDNYVFVEKKGAGRRHLARVGVCSSFACRLRGLMFRRQLSAQDGLLLVGNRDSRLDAAIHMFFVPFDLAVFWISARMQIVDKVLARRWRPFYIPARPARFILEVHPDLLTHYETGEEVEFVNA
jgi:uncharacterized membrane protein (UPF0127 family)